MVALGTISGGAFSLIDHCISVAASFFGFPEVDLATTSSSATPAPEGPLPTRTAINPRFNPKIPHRRCPNSEDDGMTRIQLEHENEKPFVLEPDTAVNSPVARVYNDKTAVLPTNIVKDEDGDERHTAVKEPNQVVSPEAKQYAVHPALEDAWKEFQREEAHLHKSVGAKAPIAKFPGNCPVKSDSSVGPQTAKKGDSFLGSGVQRRSRTKLHRCAPYWRTRQRTVSPAITGGASKLKKEARIKNVADITALEGSLPGFNEEPKTALNSSRQRMKR
eukprot:GHVT01040611.1.p1 GENE.GHVT01040611.1~~GHVT01040611.1.p1  ORF type:complete len:276 (-),score=26.74 GHVT01040611.1:1027-1854(-)